MPAGRHVRLRTGSPIMKITSAIRTGLLVVLLCVVKITIEEPLDKHPMQPLLQTTCPSQCNCTPTEMLCSGANLTEVLENVIDYPSILHLDFSNMTLKSVPKAITYMTNCKTINLSNNKINKPDNFSIQNLWLLEELILSNNSIHDISVINRDLLSFTEFKSLNLSSNPITSLGKDENSVLISNSLRVLDVSYCQITSLVGPVVLSGLTNLENLNLTNNPLKHFDGVFSYSLKTLNIRNCLIEHLGEQALGYLRNLEEFIASQNDQMFIKGDIHTSSLKKIDVSGCSLRAPNLLGMSELRSAFLNGNRIRRLVDYQFINNSKLFELDLSKNSVEFVEPLAFYGMTSLTHLDLSTNMIADLAWDTLTRTLPMLETLKLSHNFIDRVGAMTSSTLRRLDLHHCWITSVPNNAFTQLSRLSEVVLSDNPLQALQPGSFNSTHLSTLDLSYCRLSHLATREFNSLPNLTELSLAGNRLVTIKNGTFAKCPKLQLVYMDDNPWRCDCYSINFAYMAYLANKTNKNTMMIERMPHCLTPDNVTGMPWHVACRNTLAYGRDNRKNFSMAIGVILILCVSGLTAIFMAVHENIKTRRAMRRRRHLDEYGNPSRGGLGTGADEYFDEYAAAAESARKLSQLPSYDEAIMLPKPPEPVPVRHKRHSCTQTEEAAAMEAAARAEAVVAAAEAHTRLRQSSAGGGRGHGHAHVHGGGSDDWFLSPPPLPPPLPPPGLRVTHL